MSRPGYDGFCRGGIKWPSDAPLDVIATERLMKVVRDEVYISLTHCSEYVPQPGDVVLDIPEPLYIDKGAQALDEAKKLDAEAAAMQALLDLETKRVRNAKLAADLAAATSAADAKPAEKKK
jgi:hypothetical protein